MRLVFYLGIVLLQAFFEGSHTVRVNTVPFWPDPQDTYPYRKANIPPKEEVCKSWDCQQFATLFEASMNKSIAACDDFYEHACGGWESHGPSHGRAIDNQYTQTRVNVYAAIQNALLDEQLQPSELKAKSLFLSCFNEDIIEEHGIDPLKNLINEVGGWPLIHWFGHQEIDQLWLDVHERYSLRADIAALFRIGVQVDRNNSSRRMITISAPDIGRRESAVNSESGEEARSNSEKLYYNYIYEVANYLYGKPMELYRTIILNDDIMQMIRFENELSKISEFGADVDFDHGDIRYNVSTIEELQNIWNKIAYDGNTTALRYAIDWHEELQLMFQSTSVAVKTKSVAIVPGTYITNLAKLLVNTRKETVVNYIHWNAIHRLLKYTNRAMREIRNRYNSAIFGTNMNEPRWLTCIDDCQLKLTTNAQMGNNEFFRDNQIYIHKMADAIKSELKSEIMNWWWLEYTAKIQVVKKIDNIADSIGYPDWSRDFDSVDKYYDQLFLADDDYFGNVLKIRVHLMMKQLEKLDKPVDRNNTDWNIDHLDFVASYDERTNSMIIPAGVLENPYNRFDQLPAIKWGALGSLIGHEMAHSLDNVGRLYDEYGNKRQRWSRQSIVTYKTAQRCFVEKYSDYKITLSNGDTIPLDGTRTLRENIADRLGFLVGFMAFKKFPSENKVIYKIDGVTNYSQEQLYFYSFAQSLCEKVSDEYLRNVYATDVHPPSRIRVNGVLGGMWDFSRTFDCKPGDCMFEQGKQCSIWP